MKTPTIAIRSILAATILLPVLLGAKGGGCDNDDVPIGGGSTGSGGGTGTCDVGDCGPALGMPNYTCPDGTVAGPTGNCISTPDGCGWEVISCPPGDMCDPADCGPPLGMPNYICEDGSVGGPTGNCLKNADGNCGWEVRECPPASGFSWFTTCGDPACQTPDPDDPAVPNCTTEQDGNPCTTPDAVCEIPGDSCGAKLLCATADPKSDGCPISRARHKDAIAYLDARELERVRDEFLSIKMARWNYRSEPTPARQHLGFIIDDQPLSPAVMSNGERVDLYGYTSMAAATIQVQQKQIETLEREVQALREAVTNHCRK